MALATGFAAARGLLTTLAETHFPDNEWDLTVREENSVTTISLIVRVSDDEDGLTVIAEQLNGLSEPSGWTLVLSKGGNNYPSLSIDNKPRS